MRKIGILGGTFNPPHLGHLHMAKAALEEGSLDEIIWIPNGDPPHKRPEVSAADRFCMTGLAIEGEYGMSVSDLEIRRSGRSYMAETMEELKKREPDTVMFLLCGADMLPGLASWYQASSIFRMAAIMAFRRIEGAAADPETPGHSTLDELLSPDLLFRDDLNKCAAFLRQHGARVTVMKAKIPAVSSTEIRSLAREGSKDSIRKLKSLVPERVASYITEHGLYRTK